jgi:hypothetical protein
VSHCHPPLPVRENPRRFHLVPPIPVLLHLSPAKVQDEGAPFGTSNFVPVLQRRLAVAVAASLCLDFAATLRVPPSLFADSRWVLCVVPVLLSYSYSYRATTTTHQVLQLQQATGKGTSRGRVQIHVYPRRKARPPVAPIRWIGGDGAPSTC